MKNKFNKLFNKIISESTLTDEVSDTNTITYQLFMIETSIENVGIFGARMYHGQEIVYHEPEEYEIDTYTTLEEAVNDGINEMSESMADESWDFDDEYGTVGITYVSGSERKKREYTYVIKKFDGDRQIPITEEEYQQLCQIKGW